MPLMLRTTERDEVLRFLSAWRNWVLDGAEERHAVFSRTRGLCICARYGVRHRLFAPGLTVWLGTMLIEDFDDENFPFSDHDSFNREMSTKSCHLNTRRRAWVDEKLRGTGHSERFELPKRGHIYKYVDPFDNLPPPSDYLTDPEEQEDGN